MKDGFFQLRLSKDDRAKLDALARHYNVSASSAICMLIAKEVRLIAKGETNNAEKTKV